MTTLKNDEIRQAVRDTYGEVAKAGDAGCGCSSSNCCSAAATDLDALAARLGYSKDDVAAAPDGANLGLGCGNPKAIAALQAGETVLDLGSGGGFDCFLAADAVGPTGHVIGVDMTVEMVHRARQNAAKGGIDNVEFRLGEIEHLPVADGSVDVIMSNCVVNLSPEKDGVFAEAYRALKSGGRLAIADIVAVAELPAAVRADLKLHAGCVAGASTIADLEAALAAAGFVEISIRPVDETRDLLREWAPGTEIGELVTSAMIEAVKP